MDGTREASLDFLADALERILLSSSGDAQQIYRTLGAEQASLHEDALDVLANVSHFVADSDDRQRDEDYRAMQERTMRELVAALRRRASRDQLLTFSFLN